MSVISLCGNVGANTGPIDCDTRRARAVALMLGSASFDEADYATSAAFKAAFITAINQATGSSSKIFPFPEIQNTTNNTEANVTGATGTGFQFILREGKPAYTFAVIVGTNLEKKLRKFNGQVVPVFVFDANGNVWGTRDASGNFVGTKALIFVSGKPYSDGNSVETEYTNVSVSFLSATDFFDYAAFVNTDFNINDLEGLLDVELENFSLAGNVLKVQGFVRNSQLGADKNVQDIYGADLAVGGLWEAFTEATPGSGFTVSLAITSVAEDTANSAYTVTLSATPYNALDEGQSVLVKMKDPATLKAADVVGIESDSLIFAADPA